MCSNVWALVLQNRDKDGKPSNQYYRRFYLILLYDILLYALFKLPLWHDVSSDLELRRWTISYIFYCTRYRPVKAIKMIVTNFSPCDQLTGIRCIAKALMSILGNGTGYWYRAAIQTAFLRYGTPLPRSLFKIRIASVVGLFRGRGRGHFRGRVGDSSFFQVFGY